MQTNIDVDKIRGLLEKNKKTHIDWRDFLLANPDQEEKYDKIGVGGIKHQEECIREYDQAISLLKGQPCQALAGEVEELLKSKGHPEDYCHLCGGKNITWYIANELWNKVVGSQIICCPICFVKMAEKKGIVPTAWRLSREGDSPEVNELRIEKVELAEENEKLKAVIVCECDNMAAFAPFDELGNKAQFVRRVFHSVGDIIPELKDLADEVEPYQFDIMPLILGKVEEFVKELREWVERMRRNPSYYAPIGREAIKKAEKIDKACDLLEAQAKQIVRLEEEKKRLEKIAKCLHRDERNKCWIIDDLEAAKENLKFDQALRKGGE